MKTTKKAVGRSNRQATSAQTGTFKQSTVSLPQGWRAFFTISSVAMLVIGLFAICLSAANGLNHLIWGELGSYMPLGIVAGIIAAVSGKYGLELLGR